MFQFTTTHVVNSNYDLTTGKALWSLGESVVDGETVDSIHIKGVNNFKAPNILKVYKAEYTEPVFEKAEIDLDNIDAKKGDTLRLQLYIRLTEADQSPYYANDTRYKGRPFTVEFPMLASVDDTIKNFIKIAKKYALLVFEKEVVKLTANGTKIVLEAVNEFQRFHVIKIEKYVETTEPYEDQWEDLSEDAVEIVTHGVEGFGTFGWLMRNIKLPTHAHTTAFAPKQNELPIPGAKYNQYTIHYCTNRGPLGLNAVGQNVKSVTTSVFYVNTAILNEDMTSVVSGVDKDGATVTAGATDFETALKQVAGENWEEVTVENPNE